MLAYEEIAALKDRLEEENLYLIQENETEHHFEDLMGRAPHSSRGFRRRKGMRRRMPACWCLALTMNGHEMGMPMMINVRRWICHQCAHSTRSVGTLVGSSGRRLDFTDHVTICTHVRKTTHPYNVCGQRDKT
ncbi:MAG: hypothetical protein QGI34_05190 [Candidatus Latescibacteria bacterium]|nr:hypothetical protein [Candidatus Latescibacterota bacterium]